MVRSLSELFRFRFSGEQSASQGPDRPGVGAGAGLEQALALGPFRRFFGKSVSATQAGPCLAAERVLPGGLPSRGGAWRPQKVTKSVARELEQRPRTRNRPPEPGSGLRPFGDSFPS